MVVPADASAIQIRECRLAFYAGAQETLMSLLRITAGPPGELAEHEVLDGVEHLERMRLELDAFAAAQAEAFHKRR